MTSIPVESTFFQAIPYETILKYYHIAVDYGVVDLIMYPYNYADMLIRLGYEPFSPIESYDFFGKRSLILPSISTYVYYLYSVEGPVGIFRCAVPYIGANLIYRRLRSFLILRSPYEYPPEEPRLSQRFTEKNLLYFLRTKTWHLVSSLIALHVALPLQVLAVRSMARFVTEHTTTLAHRPKISWLSCVLEEVLMYRSPAEAVAGSLAKSLREISAATISACCFLGMMKLSHSTQMIHTSDQADTFENSVDYIASAFATNYTLPLKNAAEISMINVANMPLGNPPFNTMTSNSITCLLELPPDRAWKTSETFFQTSRSYKGPAVIRPDGTRHALASFGPLYLPTYASSKEDVPWLLRHFYQGNDQHLSPLAKMVFSQSGSNNYQEPIQMSFFSPFGASINPLRL